MANPTFPDNARPDVPGAPAAPELPAQVGPYRLQAVVGEGGMGVVYRAEQRAPIHRTVALKLIKLGMDTQEVVRRFESERQALALMNHPNVAKVFDAGATDAGRPYFVMEFVAGEPITAYCDRNRLTNRQRLLLFVQACDAVQHAHQKGIIHRDIKPSNILVTVLDDQPVVKVIDFGVAKATDHRLTERTLFTRIGELVGTPEYMSPEQAESGPVDIDTRTDVYALGVVLYELLTGASPFDPVSLRRVAYAEIQRVIRDVEPPRPSTRLSSLGADASSQIALRRRSELGRLLRELRGDLDLIVMKAMEKDRTRRYGSASELAADVQRHLRDEPVSAAAPGTWYQVVKFARRNRVLVSAVAIVILTLSAGITSTAVMAVRAARAESRTRDEQARTLAEKSAADAARDQANREAAKATAVLRFVTDDLLGAANPAQALGRELSVREALDQAANIVVTRFGDQRDVRAAIEHVIGATYLSMTRFPQAEAHLRDALRLRSGAGAESTAAAETQLVLGQTLCSAGKYDEGQQMLQGAADAFARADRPTDVVRVKMQQASALSHQGDQTRAESLVRDAIATMQSLPNVAPREMARAKHNLGTVLQLQGRADEAEPLLRESLEFLRRAVPPGQPDPDLAASIEQLAVFLVISKNDNAAAEPLLREALAMREKLYGADTYWCIRDIGMLGTVYRELGRLDEAQASLQQAIATSERLFGPNHEMVLRGLSDLAAVQMERRDPAAAEASMRRIIEFHRRSPGSKNPLLAAALARLGYILRTTDRAGEAEKVLRESLDIHRALNDPHDNDISFTLNELALAIGSRGQPAEAEKLQREAIARAPEDDREVLIYRARLARWIALQQRFEEAEKQLQDVVPELQRTFGPNASNTAEAISILADVYDAWGKPDQAAEWRAKLKAILSATQPATQSTTQPATSPG